MYIQLNECIGAKGRPFLKQILIVSYKLLGSSAPEPIIHRYVLQFRRVLNRVKYSKVDPLYFIIPG